MAVPPSLNAADLDKALDAVKETYEQLVKAGIDPAVVVIAMSEIIAYCLAHKALSGGGEADTLRVWRTAFETTYRDQLREMQH